MSFNFQILLLIITFSHVSTNPLRHICENFQSKPAEFAINSILVVVLLIAGGILAGMIFNFLKNEDYDITMFYFYF